MLLLSATDIPATPPQRIVSLVPSQTELLADLGLDEQVVGLTRFCVHPTDWKAHKTIVGGTKNVRLDRVAALAPDLILTNKEENVREQVEALAEIAPVHVTDMATVDDALAMIRTIGALTHCPDAARALVEAIASGFAGLCTADPIRVAYLIWREPYMTVGGDTFISDVLARAGLVNVFADRLRYPQVTPAMLADLQPDAILLSSEPYPFTAQHAATLETETDLPTMLVDGELCSWYGSRMRLAPAYLTRLRASLSARLPVS